MNGNKSSAAVGFLACLAIVTLIAMGWVVWKQQKLSDQHEIFQGRLDEMIANREKVTQEWQQAATIVLKQLELEENASRARAANEAAHK